MTFKADKPFDNDVELLELNERRNVFCYLNCTVCACAQTASEHTMPYSKFALLQSDLKSRLSLTPTSWRMMELISHYCFTSCVRKRGDHALIRQILNIHSQNWQNTKVLHFFFRRCSEVQVDILAVTLSFSKSQMISLRKFIQGSSTEICIHIAETIVFNISVNAFWQVKKELTPYFGQNTV